MKATVVESLFNKVLDLQGCSFIKKRLQHRCFPGRIAKILKTIILKEQLRMAAYEFSKTVF